MAVHLGRVGDAARRGGVVTALARLRALCLALPEAVEKRTWDTPTFRVRDKIFAMVHSVEGGLTVWCKAPRGVQAILVEAAPKRFFVPPYVGHKGWIGIRLDADVDWAEMDDLVRRSWGMTAPKRLASQGGQSRSSGGVKLHRKMSGDASDRTETNRPDG